MRYLFLGLLTFTVGASLFWMPACVLSATEKVKKPVEESIHIRQQTQKDEEQWRNDKEQLLARLDNLNQKIKLLSEQKTDLENKIKTAKERIKSKNKELTDIEAIRSSISPLIARMIQQLQTFVAADLPFLNEERKNRLQHLVELRDNPDIAVSEKFRKVLEALLVESEYGNSIEMYQQTISIDGHKRLANIFRLGRVSLFFQTIDQKTCGFYNMASKSWQRLDTEYSRAIASAIEIGAKRRPVELLTLPLGRIQPL